MQSVGTQVGARVLFVQALLTSERSVQAVTRCIADGLIKPNTAPQRPSNRIYPASVPTAVDKESAQVYRPATVQDVDDMPNLRTASNMTSLDNYDMWWVPA